MRDTTPYSTLHAAQQCREQARRFDLCEASCAHRVLQTLAVGQLLLSGAARGDKGARQAGGGPGDGGPRERRGMEFAEQARPLGRTAGREEARGATGRGDEDGRSGLGRRTGTMRGEKRLRVTIGRGCWRCASSLAARDRVVSERQLLVQVTASMRPRARVTSAGRRALVHGGSFCRWVGKHCSVDLLAIVWVGEDHRRLEFQGIEASKIPQSRAYVVGLGNVQLAPGEAFADSRDHSKDDTLRTISKCSISTGHSSFWPEHPRMYPGRLCWRGIPQISKFRNRICHLAASISTLFGGKGSPLCKPKHTIFTYILNRSCFLNTRHNTCFGSPCTFMLFLLAMCTAYCSIRCA